MSRLTVDEIASVDRWRCDRRVVLNAIHSKTDPLIAIKIGGRWLIDETDLEAYEAAHRNFTPKKRAHRPPRSRAKKGRAA